jgi:hypothetical protein
MDPRDLSDTIMGISIIMSVAVSIGFLKVVSVWANRRKGAPLPNPGYDPEAIARLQSSVDAISIEVERISEGQRFTTRLLNERVAQPSSVPAERGESLVGH